MSKVYVPQVPSTLVSGVWQPKYDLSAVEEFGELTVLLEPGNTELSLAQAAADQIGDAMAFAGREDYLLPMGDPVLIAVAAAVFAENTGGLIRLLRWDRWARRYVLFEIVMP